MLGEILLSFLKNDLALVGSVGAGCIMIAGKLERRSGFVYRAILSYAVVSMWMLLVNFVTPRTIFGLIMDNSSRAILRYIGLFILFGLSVGWMSKASFCQMLYAATISYSIQNLVTQFYQLMPLSDPQHFPEVLGRISMALMLCISFYAYYRCCLSSKSKRQVTNFSNLNSIIMLFLGVGVLAINIWLDIWLRGYVGQDPVLLTWVIAMSAIFSFLTGVLSTSHLRETDYEIRIGVANQLLHAERARYEQEKQVHQAINVKCHDIRHQIAALGETGYRKELAELGELVNLYDSTPHTQSSALDLVMNIKALACHSQNILLTSLADGRRIGFMEDSDIYSLFGNILDNAIDAVSRIDDPEKRVISLTVSDRNGLLLIEEENFCHSPLVFEDGLPITTKSNRDYHGFGMQSIRLLTEKYKGSLKVKQDEGVFRLSIMLPIPKEQAAQGSPASA